MKRRPNNRHGFPGRWTALAVQSGIVILLLTSLTACGLMRVPASAPQPVPTAPTAQVTADQIALAMQEERFFSDYGRTTLLIRGTVSSVIRQNDDLIVELSTGLPTKVLCDLGNLSSPIHAGDTITVQAQSADAQRAPSAVLLKNCRIP